MASITVVGAGIFGLSVAWEITRRGHHVRIIEAVGIGAGSSGGTVGALAPHTPDSWNEKKMVQFVSLLGAEKFWDKIAQASGCNPGYARTGRVQAVATIDLPKLHARIESAHKNWGRAARMWLTQSRPDGPLIPESPDSWWLMDDLTARLSPQLAIAALSAAITNKGGEIITGQSATFHDIFSDPVIWATGVSGLTMLSDDLGYKVGQGVKGQSALLQFSAARAPQVYADGIHIVPHADGTVGIGSTSENNYTYEHTDTRLDDIIIRAQAACPALKDARILNHWAGIRPRAKSRAPLMGRWPGRDDQFVLNGGFKIGFGMAPILASLMADLVLDGQDSIPNKFRLQGRGDTPMTGA